MIKSLSLQKMGSLKESLDAATMAVRLAPDNADAHFLLGSIMFNATQSEAAITEYKEALQLSKQHRKFAIYSQARILDALVQASASFGKHEVAEAAYKKEYESTLSGKLKEISEDISQSKVLSEAARGLME